MSGNIRDCRETNKIYTPKAIKQLISDSVRRERYINLEQRGNHGI